MAPRPRPDVNSWFVKMLVVSLAISLAASVAELLLASAGLMAGAGSLLVGLVCASTVSRMPRPVADAWLQWRVGAWAGRALAAAMLVIGAVLDQVLPFWWSIGVMIAVLWTTTLVIGWAVERWARRAVARGSDEPAYE